MLKKCLMKMLLSKIEYADDQEIAQMTQAIIRRYSRVFPDWEIMFLSMPKFDQAERVRTAEYLLASIRESSAQE